MHLNAELNLKYKNKTQNINSHIQVRNFKIKNGVIFIDSIMNGSHRERPYWFNKYLQDLQSRGITKKIVRIY